MCVCVSLSVCEEQHLGMVQTEALTKHGRVLLLSEIILTSRISQRHKPLIHFTGQLKENISSAGDCWVNAKTAGGQTDRQTDTL